MTDIEEKIAKAEEEIRQLQNRKRKLLNQKKDAERKARTHRLRLARKDPARTSIRVSGLPNFWRSSQETQVNRSNFVRSSPDR